LRGNDEEVSAILKTVLLHKWYAFIASRRLRVPIWRLVEHDLSKFYFAEFAAYARRLYGDGKDRQGFDRASPEQPYWNQQ
jgi:hypothetical protein